MTTLTRTPDERIKLAEACANDWPRLMYDGFGIMVSPEQEEAYERIGIPGPREEGEYKNNWVSGGQRAGKTVFAFGMHADAALYKRGLDGTDRRYWRNYQYGTLAIAPTDALTLRLWAIGDEISKGSSDAQFDRSARRFRGGAFIGKFSAGVDRKGNGIWRFSNGSRVDFRSSEGWAYRLEGGQWWFITWDEWASQPDREIHAILTDVLFGRARDHDAKIMPMAWPKRETEHNLIEVIRKIESGEDIDSQVVYLSARRAPWTNKAALEVELRNKDKHQIQRTIDGEPAGGAQTEFKDWMTTNMLVADAVVPELPDHEHNFYFSSWDLGLGNDSNVGGSWRIPIMNGRPVVHPTAKMRLVEIEELEGGPNLSPDTVIHRVHARQLLYRGRTAVDATGMGGLMAVRKLKNMAPKPLGFVSKANDRIHGNIRLAAITNGLEMATWGRPLDDEGVPIPPQDDEVPVPWGLIELPTPGGKALVTKLIDQLHAFDRDEDDQPDDFVWMFLIACWYVRRYWVLDDRVSRGPVDFDVRRSQSDAAETHGRRRARLIRNEAVGPAVAPSGVRYIYQRGDPRGKRG